MLAVGLAWPEVSFADEDDSAGQDYVVKVWGADEGLTEGSVTDVAQTPEGYLWVGTVFGSVLRFDGTRFVSYNSANTPEFSFKWGVPRLMADRGGTLWISMVDGGLTSWDKNGFRSIFTSTNQPDRILWSALGKVIFVYGGGKLLCGNKTGEQWMTFQQRTHAFRRDEENIHAGKLLLDRRETGRGNDDIPDAVRSRNN